MAGCDTAFTTNNYGVTTTPQKEYGIATGKQECPEEDMLDRKKRKVRIIHKIDALKTLEICKKAGLKDYEILAVVSRSRCAAALLFLSDLEPCTTVMHPFGLGRNSGRGGCGGGRGGAGDWQVLYTGPMFQVSSPAFLSRSESPPLCPVLSAHPGVC